MFTAKPKPLSVEEVREIWNDWVDRYPDPLESVGRPAKPELLAGIIPDVIRKLSLMPGDLLLDVGCGSGVMLNEIVKTVALRATGVDIAEKHILNAQKFFPEIHFQPAPIEKLPFPDDSFNKILAYSTLSYSLDWKKSVDEVLRVCKDGGMILLADLPLWDLRAHFYWSVVSSIPSVLLDWKRLFRAFSWKSNDCPWRWVHLSDLKAYILSQGHTMEVFPQPDIRQYGCATFRYRRDILVKKH